MKLVKRKSNHAHAHRKKKKTDKNNLYVTCMQNREVPVSYQYQ